MTDTLVETEPIVETRSGEGFQVADVNFPKRIVTCVAMPYERPTETHYRGGRTITEVVSRGAFDGIEKRAGKIRVNRDHSWGKPVGKIVALHPSRKEGLVTEVRVVASLTGDETLALCDDDVLSASAGFLLLRRDDGRVWDDAETWDRSRNVRRLNRLWLDHLAFVPDPAYSDATVLSVRSGPGVQEFGTPNRDLLALEDLKARFDEIDRRWPH